jgi:hypothetical protein
MRGVMLKNMNKKLPTRISFRNGPSQIKLGSTIEEVIGILGEPSETWNDGVEAYVCYMFPTHEISFEFRVSKEPPYTTSVENCEIWVHKKLPIIKLYNVLTTSDIGEIKTVHSNLSKDEATSLMAKENEKHGIATHWVSFSASLLENQ